MCQSDTFQSEFRRTIIETLKRYSSPDNIHKVEAAVLNSFPDSLDYLFGTAQPLGDLQQTILAKTKTVSEAVRQQVRRSIAKHVSLDSSVKQPGEKSFTARIGDMIAARTLVSVHDQIWFEETVEDARRSIEEAPRRKSKQTDARKQVADAVALHLRSGISFAAALLEVQATQGAKVKSSTAAAWWDDAREQMKIRHSYILKRSRPELMDGRRKAPKAKKPHWPPHLGSAEKPPALADNGAKPPKIKRID